MELFMTSKQRLEAPNKRHSERVIALDENVLDPQEGMQMCYVCQDQHIPLMYPSAADAPSESKVANQLASKLVY